MTVTNLTTKQPDHVKVMAYFALDALKAASTTLIDESDPSKGLVQIRAGFHSGPVAAHVIGESNPRYSIIGDSKFEQTSPLVCSLLTVCSLIKSCERSSAYGEQFKGWSNPMFI